ncbi:MAG: nitroreductase family protein [bacterium]
MSIMNTIKIRKSVRAYITDKEINATDLNTILEAGRLAPSAKNMQEWKFLVIRDKKIMAQLVPMCRDQKFIAQASAVILGCSDQPDYIMMCGQNAYTVDLSISTEHMSLMAAELGIGSCWIGSFSEETVKELLNIPSKVRIVSMLTLGYPVQDLKTIVTTTRKHLEEIVCYDKWNF